MALVKRGNSASDRTRHVAIRYYWIKDRVDAGEVEIVYMPTEDMIADALTKPLQGEAFKRLRQLLLNWTV
jgi:ABC-type nitrate/sulfonate/bicarbonate transport system substrate-binding protein